RRKFFLTSLAGSAAAGVTNLFARTEPAAVAGNGTLPLAPPAQGKRPVIISSANGVNALGRGMDILKKGGDTLDAVIAAVTVVEDDPNDDSVGYGGLPNEEGEVELDASCMHGPTHRAGSVASVRRIKNVARLAKTVMERTNHVMIVGDGARRFAVAEGFEEMNLLTEHSRKIWLAWKASSSFNWRPGIDSPEWKEKMSSIFSDSPEDQALMAYAQRVIADPPTGTIPCMAVNEKGDISATTTTSGLSWKIPGRVGDSPIIGAGCCVDNEVGAAGSTGKGEENIKISGGHTIVEMMRKGMSPTDACMEALARVARNYNNDKKKLATFHIFFYALNKDGAHGAASLWQNAYDKGHRATYAVHDGAESRLVDCKPYFDETAVSD
ncbi:MAG TPA: N(4)-(beta-N-acetylglucosaminyl)-L-asparaginase, partial [Candidatus Acidoferrales bacterium]|nr:N(4)-(beta-N-acetylglucosaminyl)-L-asparaginase [Candidatus Acidoferrales bacterium]